MLALKTYLSYFVVALVALQVLNLGLYAQDFNTIQRGAYGESSNIINSVTEYVAEVLMNKKNAFPEKKEKSNQSEHEDMYKFQPFKIYITSSNESIQPELIQLHNYGRFLIHRYINHTTDITSPPPKPVSPV